MRQISKVLTVVVLSFAIAACGFHLRGKLPLSETVNVIFIDADNGDFKRDLVKGLKLAGATIVDEPSQAKAILQIVDEYTEREVLTVDSQGDASSYKLFYIVDFLVANSQQELLKEGRVSENRQYSFRAGQAIRQEREEEELVEEMSQEIVVRIMRQLATL